MKIKNSFLLLTALFLSFGASAQDWSLSGNVGTGNPFIGTTDASPFVIKTNNTEAFRVDLNGNIGVNTVSPQGLLHLNSANLDESIFIGNGTAETVVKQNTIVFSQPNTGSGNNQLRWLDGSGNVLGGISGSTFGGPNLWLGSSKENSFVRFVIGGTNQSFEKVRFTSNGRVGILTTAPTANLHVVGNARITDLPFAPEEEEVYIVAADNYGNLYRAACSRFDCTTSSSRSNEQTETQLNAAYDMIKSLNARLERLEKQLNEKSTSSLEDLGNYPNPFNTFTNIEYTLTNEGQTTLIIYDLSGKLIKAENLGLQARGQYTYRWESNDLPAGNYQYTINVNGTPHSKKAILIK